LSKVRGRVLFAFLLIALVVLLGDVQGSASSGSETRLGFYVCPKVTTTIYPQTPSQTLPGCGPPVMSPNDHNPTPSGDLCQPASTNTDLGAFVTTQNPLGAFVASGAPSNCSTSPPTLGPGAGGAALNVSAVQRGFCPTTLTVAPHEGPIGGVFFPIGNLPLGKYDVTVTLPPQTATDGYGVVTAWAGVSVTGVLSVGAKFTETDAHALVTRNAFGVLLRNSFAGPGAGALVSSKNGNTERLAGTDYYACGTIKVSATVTYGKRGTNGVVRLTGSGNLVGGTGNYKDIKGAFMLRGSYSTKTSRGTFVLTGEAGF
jgi:hypothetical protein